MKHTKQMAIVTLLFLAVSGAAAQSLGDYARTVRKNKPDASLTTRHYDNDNLPSNDGLSVVGPPPSGEAKPAQAAAPSPAAAAAESKKAADEWQKKLDSQKQKIDALTHELDLNQRELRLRQAAYSGDPTIALHNAQYDKDVAQEKNDIDSKQKEIEEARQQLSDLQEEARKAGIADKEKDEGSEKTSEQNNDKK